jgi:hypothetical protein
MSDVSPEKLVASMNFVQALDDGCKPKGWIEAGGADYLPERAVGRR